MFSFRKFICSFGFALALVSGTAIALPYSNLVIFGDSLTDAGNNAIVIDTQVAPPATPPGTFRTPIPISSPAFIPSFPYASDRYSNGPVWVEQLAAKLGLSAAPSVLGGTNFSFGGARTGPAGSSFPFSLTDQVQLFLDGTGGTAQAMRFTSSPAAATMPATQRNLRSLAAIQPQLLRRT